MKMNLTLSLLSVMSVAMIVCSEDEKSEVVRLKDLYKVNYREYGQDYAWAKLNEQTEHFPESAYALPHIVIAANKEMYQEDLAQKKDLIKKKEAEIKEASRKQFEKDLAVKKQANAAIMGAEELLEWENKEIKFFEVRVKARAQHEARINKS